jgi:phage tail-like protein
VARAATTDPLLTCNFALIDVPVTGAGHPTAFPDFKSKESSFVGFQQIDMPEATMETKTIKEGNWPKIHKVPIGFMNAGQVTLRHAVMPTNTDMYQWFLQALWGRVAPRRHLVVVHLRADKLVQQRKLLLSDCFPTTWRPSTALDATSTEVVTEELTLEVGSLSYIE